MSAGATRAFATSLLCCLSLLAGSVLAADRPWYKYENAYFVAYSDASERKVRRLLEELENFRAAVTQVVNFKIPADAEKTQVVIFRSRSDFQEIVNNPNIAGFASRVGGVPFIVMPAGSSNWSETTIRHEFTHVLLGYSGHRFPGWYNEGFAELMSATRFRKKNTQFTVGHLTGRRNSGADFVSWEMLMSSSFNIHAMNSGATLSNAYLQAWILVHYLTIGDNGDLGERLGRYLARFDAGETSRSVFIEEFGMTPGQLGNHVAQEYEKRAGYLVINFLPAIRDFEFVRSGIEAATITDLVKRIDVNFNGRGR